METVKGRRRKKWNARSWKFVFVFAITALCSKKLHFVSAVGIGVSCLFVYLSIFLSYYSEITICL